MGGIWWRRLSEREKEREVAVTWMTAQCHAGEENCHGGQAYQRINKSAK